MTSYGRRVMVYEFVTSGVGGSKRLIVDNSETCGYKRKEFKKAIFFEFSQSNEEGEELKAIVEYKNGDIEAVSISLIRFLD